jgi:DNA-binding response OmpR family regulator
VRIRLDDAERRLTVRDQDDLRWVDVHIDRLRAEIAARHEA